MARESGSYREGYFATIAAANAALDAFVTAIDTRLDVDGTQAITASGTFAMNVTAENGAGDEYTHRGSVTFDTDTVAIGVALTNCITIITAFDAFMTSVEGASLYTAVTKVDVTANIVMTN
jgi:hypothetical protein